MSQNFEIFPKASFGTSNVFVCEFCARTFRFDERMKNHIIAYKYLKPESSPKASFGTSIVSNAKYALTGSILLML